MPIRTNEDLIQAISRETPQACCDHYERCIASPDKKCLSDASLAAAPHGFHVRLGLHPEKTEKNPQGAGPKVWYPNRVNWFQIATLGEDLPAADLRPGVYTVLFGDHQATPKEIATRAPWVIEYEPSATPSEAPLPQARQGHLEDVHSAVIKRAQIDNQAQEGHAQTARFAHQLALDTLKETAELQRTARAELANHYEVLNGQAEALGRVMETNLRLMDTMAQRALDQRPQESTVTGLAREIKEILVPLVPTVMSIVMSAKGGQAPPPLPSAQKSPPSRQLPPVEKKIVLTDRD